MSALPRDDDLTITLVEELLFALHDKQQRLRLHQRRLEAVRQSIEGPLPHVLKPSVDLLIEDCRRELALIEDEVDLVGALAVHAHRWTYGSEEFTRRARRALKAITARHRALAAARPLRRPCALEEAILL